MNKLKKINPFLVLAIIGIFLFSCQKDDDIGISKAKNEKPTEVDVSVDLASEVALTFSNKVPFFKKPSGENLRTSSPFPGFEEKEIEEVIIIPDDTNSPSLYIVTFIPNGYVIVSATKKESPILGYSENAIFDFEKLPSGMAIWLVDKMDKIQILKYSANIEISEEVKSQWNLLLPSPYDGREVVKPGGT